MGLGRSGVALARVFDALGADLLVSDSRPAEALVGPLQQVSQLNAEVEVGGHTERLYEGRQLLVISPGVSVHHPIVQAALGRGIPVAGEVEIAACLSSRPFVAVTGTNGKSTTVTLVHRMLSPRSLLAGNIGTPLVAEVHCLDPMVEWVVAEISSFQLETVHAFSPSLAVCSNVTPDHLDRHPSFEEYVAAKARIFSLQGPSDRAILSADDPVCVELAACLRSGQLPAWLPGFPVPERPARPQVYQFSMKGEVPRGVWLAHDRVLFRDGGPAEEVLAWDFPALRGPRCMNALAALLVGRLLKVSPQRMGEVLKSHSPLHFRLEDAGTVAGVRFVNDSKATNAASVEAALGSFDEPLVLIAGGKDKGIDYTQLGRAIANRSRHLVLIGEAAEKIATAVRQAGLNYIHHCDTLREAVLRAYRLAEPGGVVLLSPACSSFDMFENAEDRGEQFNLLVDELVRHGGCNEKFE